MSDPTEPLQVCANPKTPARQSLTASPLPGAVYSREEAAYWQKVSDGISSALGALPEDV